MCISSDWGRCLVKAFMIFEAYSHLKAIIILINHIRGVIKAIWLEKVRNYALIIKVFKRTAPSYGTNAEPYLFRIFRPENVVCDQDTEKQSYLTW